MPTFTALAVIKYYENRNKSVLVLCPKKLAANWNIYRGANLGEGKKSMAFSLTLSDPSEEISAEQVERTVKKVLGNLKFKLGIEIR